MNLQNKPINERLHGLSHKVVQFASISLLTLALPVSATEISTNDLKIATKEKNNSLVYLTKELKDDTSSFVVQKKITGTVFDQNGQTLPGANIVVKGTSISTQTDIDGQFS